ncbi:hypothetical protein [Gimesia sp.]|uniref:hypothetical protein n=1 Tax=Gimesia sp. TaxID=2024833 RepID=UPI003A954372
MSSAFVVTTRLIYKRAWPQALCCVAAFVLFPYVALKVIAHTEGTEWRVNADISEFGFLFGYYMLQSSIVYLSISVAVMTGFQKYFLRLPIPSRTIASGMMFTVVMLFLSMQLVTNGFYRLLFFDQNWLSDYWPLTGTLLFLVTLTLVGYAVFWLMQAPSLTRLCASVSFIAGMLVWFVSRFYPAGFSGGVVPWTQVTLSEFGTMLVVSVGAWYLGTIAFAQIRSGTAVPSPAWESCKQWWNTLAVGRAAKHQHDQYPQTAIASLMHVHWREACHRVTLVGGILAFTAFLLNLAALFDRPDPFFPDIRQLFITSHLNLTGLVLLVAISALVLQMGNSLSAKGNPQMKTYWAILPLSDRELATALLENILRCVLLLLLIIVPVALGGSYFLFVLYHGMWLVRADWEWVCEYETYLVLNAFYYVVLDLLFFWSVAANAILYFWLPVLCAGWRALYSLTSLFCVSFFVSVLWPGLEASVFLLDACLIWGVTVLAFMHAYRSALIGKKTIWLAALFSLIISIVYWDFWGTDLLSSRILLSSLLVLPVLPFATIPLAVSWNRHR